MGELKSSDTAGARTVFEAMAKRGLNDDLRAQIESTIEAAQTQAKPVAAARVSKDEIQKAWQLQHEAYDRLNLWYNDWATTLRSELGYNASLRLGLIKQRGRQIVTEIEVDDLAATVDPVVDAMD